MDADRDNARVAAAQPSSAVRADAIVTEATSGSPSKPHGSPSSKPNGSPSRHANKLTIDPNATLAAISAKLATVIPPAESEIARINREALASVSKRYQQQLARSKTHHQQDVTELLTQQQEDGDNDSECASPIALESPSSLATAPSNPTRNAIPAALHESIIAEEWVNVHLETTGTFLLPATDIQPLLQKMSAARGDDDSTLANDDSDADAAFAFRKRGVDSGPLGRAGIDRASLYRLGMPKDLVDRLYRALYVYTNGFHSLINEIAAQCPPAVEKHVSSNVWLTFLLLLEQCENGKYEMAMLKFKHAAQTWRQQVTDAFNAERLQLETDVHALQSQLADEAQRGTEKSDVIERLAADAVVANQTIASQQQELAVQSEQIRVLQLELLVHEDDARKLNDELDDTRKEFEVANAERINAHAAQSALDDEICKLQTALERVEADKASYAKRMHEGLFMNQALRATTETLKANAVILAMERDKVTNNRDELLTHVATLQREAEALVVAKAQVEKELVEAQRRHEHLDARIETMKEQFALEVATNVQHVQAIAALTSALDEEKVQVGVLEAQCSLLTSEKQNTGMRAQDKLRIERLLNQKLELETVVETLKLERTRDQEQIWSLRASLEALDTEMQHAKRVFSASQQAFLHSERTCEHLRGQLQDVEKSYQKASKNLASLKERFKLFEESVKDQTTKLEVELKVTHAQLREVSYANRDNTATIAELHKTLDAAAKELTRTKVQLEASEQSFARLETAKAVLERDKTQRELQHSTSRSAVETFIRALQHILALVKADEYPLDEALRELLRLAHATFGRELCIDRVLDDEDEAVEFEEELDDDDVRDAKRARHKLRRSGLLLPPGVDESLSACDTAISADNADDRDDADDPSAERRHTQVTSMSKFRKSKLDRLVKKLQRDVENKTELIQSLESVVCEQADSVAQLTRVSEQQQLALAQRVDQLGMLRADVDATTLALVDERQARCCADDERRHAETDRDNETQRALALQHALEHLRRAFDCASATNEDLLGRIGRAYDHYLLMLSLRRDEAVQATVAVAEHATQTLVPQRNPALERARVAAMTLPAANAMATTFEDVIKQINRNARVLLPEAARDIVRPQHVVERDVAGAIGSTVPVVHDVHRSRAADGVAAVRPRREVESMHTQSKRYERTCGKQARLTQQALGLPAIEQQQQQQQPQRHKHALAPHIVRHVNEFGTRQDVLVSPVYPPYFSADRHTRLGDAGATATHNKTPRKPLEQPQHRRRFQYRTAGGAAETSGDERCSDALDFASGAATLEASAASASDTGLRYHRGFLRTGMEVLRGSARGLPEDDDNNDDGYDDGVGYDDDDELFDSANEIDSCGHRSGHDVTVSLSPRSPGRLEHAIHGFQRARGEQTLEAQQRHRNNVTSSKDEQWRSASSAPSRNLNDRDDGSSRDADLVQELSSSRFVPAVLYPLLPTQRQ